MTTYTQLPERMRIIELARRLDVPAAELQKRLAQLDIVAPTVLTSITRPDIRLVLEDYHTAPTDGSPAPDPDLVEELLDSLGPSPFSRLADAAVTGDNDFVAHFRKDGETERAPAETDLAVHVDLVAEGDDEATTDAATTEEVATDLLPERMRIFELGKRLDLAAADLQKQFNLVGVEANSVLKAVDRSQMRLVLERYRDGGDESSSPDPALIEKLLTALGDASADELDDDDRPEVEDDVEHDEQDAVVESEPASTDDPPDEVADQRVSDQIETPVPVLAEQEVGAGGEEPWTRPETRVESMTAPIEISEPDVDEPAPTEPVLDSSRDAILQAALARAGVVDADTVSGEQTAGEVDTTEEAAERPRGFFRRWRGVKARTRIIAVGVGILLGTILLATVYAVLRPTYAAESEIVISISGLAGEEIQRELQSYAVVASSQTVLAPVAEDFDMSVVEVREAFSPEIVGDSTVIRFTTTGSNPEQALALNEAITASYLDIANNPLDQSQLTFVNERIDALTGQLDELDDDLSEVELLEAANASTRLRIESESNIAQAQLADLQGLLVDLRASGDAPAGSVNFVEGQINATETRLEELVTNAQTLETEDAGVRSTAERLRDERAVLRAELADLQELQVQIEFDQVAGNRVAVLAPGHATDDAVGLTPVRAVILGLLVGGALAFAWVVAATQLRKKK